MRTTTNDTFPLIQALPGDLLKPIQTFQEQVDAALAAPLSPAINSAHITVPTITSADIGGTMQNTNVTAGNFAVQSFKNAAADQVYVGAQFIGPTSTAGADFLVATRAIGGSLPVERLRISSEGVFTAGPLGALTDGSSWALSQVRFTQNLDPANGKFYLMNLQPYATAVSGSVTSYEKAGLIIEAKTNDPSTGGISRDMVGIDSRGIIASTNPSGRVWGINTQAIIESGGDGLAVAGEFGVVNAGSDQPLINTTTTKEVLRVISGGNITVGIDIIASSGGFHKGIYMEPTAILGTHANDSFIELQGTWRVKKDGTTGIGTSSPSSFFQVLDQSNYSFNIEGNGGGASQTYVIAQTAGASASAVPFFIAKRSRGTIASPTSLSSGDELFRLGVMGYHSSSAYDSARKIIVAQTTEAWTASAMGYDVGIWTRPNGTASTPTERIRITHDGNVGIGMTPVNVLDILRTQNTATAGQISNLDAGASSFAEFKSTSDWGSTRLIAHATGRTSLRYGVALGGFGEVIPTAGNGLLLGTGILAKPIIFGTGDGTDSFERGRFDANGLTIASLTASRALVSNASKVLVSSSVTAIELGYLSGVTSPIQTQLNATAPTGATYITQTPSSGLSAEQAMSALATGLVKNTTGTGIQSIAAVSDIATLVANKNYALHFNGNQQTVDFGQFWSNNAGVNIGLMFWEFWCRPDSGANYIISDGYGGAHAVLLGFNGATSGRTTLTGNTWSRLNVTNATNASPIVITTSAAHSFISGTSVIIAGVLGNTAANGTFNITVIDSTHFSIPVAGTGAYTSGGTAEGLVTFGADDSPALGEWCLIGISWEGNFLTLYYNGVPVGSIAFTGPRTTPGSAQGAGVLYVGGSDHQNFVGMIGQVRGWDNANPIGPFSDGANLVPRPYVPEMYMGARALQPLGTPPTLSTDPIATFLATFLQPRSIIPDDVGGFVGVLKNVTNGVGTPNKLIYPVADYQLDSGAPTYDTTAGPSASLPVESVPGIPSVPGGARVFDSFTRINSTWCYGQEGGLQSTEGGSAGVKTWNIDTPTNTSFAPVMFGILNGIAVPLTSNMGLAWVTAVGTADMDVRVDRRPGSWLSGINTGLAFRVLDKDNFLFAYTTGMTAAATTLHLCKFVAGTRTTDVIASVAMPSSWTTLRVACSGTTINVYADATLKMTTTISDHSTQTGAGLWCQFGGSAGMLPRWDNFTVF